MIARVIQNDVNAIVQSQRLRRITLTEVWMILDIMRKPNSIIALLYNYKWNLLLLFPGVNSRAELVTLAPANARNGANADVSVITKNNKYES